MELPSEKRRYEDWTIRTMDSPEGITCKVSWHFLRAAELMDVTATEAVNDVVRRYRLGQDVKRRPGGVMLWWRGTAVAVIDDGLASEPTLPAHLSRGPLRIDAFSMDVAADVRRRR